MDTFWNYINSSHEFRRKFYHKFWMLIKKYFILLLNLYYKKVIYYKIFILHLTKKKNKIFSENYWLWNLKEILPGRVTLFFAEKELSIFISYNSIGFQKITFMKSTAFERRSRDFDLKVFRSIFLDQKRRNEIFSQ